MRIFERSDDIQSFLNGYKNDDKEVALVPTMGGLHDGHLKLVERAKVNSNVVVVSIFVNPTQFSKGEDFKSYPKTLADDKVLLEAQDIDVLFIPSFSEIYPNGTESSYDVGEMGTILCGMFRPSHFNGVAQVVRRLFEIVRPDYAFFGEKDYQQLLIIKSLVNNFNFSVSIKSIAIQREGDGLAMSTRNQYLSTEERKIAPLFYMQLCKAKDALERGEPIEIVKERAFNELINDFEVEYLELLNANNLTQIATTTSSEVIIISAIRLGDTRLIDNIVFRRPNV